jgi:hypothetical protein
MPQVCATRHIAAQDRARAVLLDATWTNEALRRYEGARTILGSYRAVLRVSATVVGIATGFGELPWRQVAKKNMRHDIG